MTQGKENRCPACGTDIPSASPAGMCPKCLLRPKVGSEADLEASAWPTSMVPRLPDSGPSSGSDPESVGPYCIVELLAEGGMGQVYVAEQRKPIRRRVALKVIKPGMDSEEVLSRFEAERQAVALMEHPSIAMVFDAGTTDEGRPYFAMELVEGKPVTEFCDARKLSLRERLVLFRQICEAVQHAHQKGIIHRDLKPSNILVAEGDNGNPVPKIIDFGIAKALGPGLTEHTLNTVLGHIVGTPQYMSPEQASLDAGDVDTRSDIYSLGVLLYELLTGRTPVGTEQVKEAGIEAVLRKIREEEAPRLATLLGTMDDALRTIVAATRRLSPSKHTQTLRGDLDWIVMKALEKERGRRYETANAFGLDVGRYLNDEAVMATPPSAGYKLRKFARRNKGLFVAGGAVAAVLVAGILATFWQAAAARAEQRRAERLVSFMLNDLRTKLSDVGRLELMEGVESAVRGYYDGDRSDGDRSEELLEGSPEERRALALASASETLEKQGRLDEALAATSEAVAIWRSVRKSEPANLGHAEALAGELLRQAWLFRQRGSLPQTDECLEETLVLLGEAPAERLSETGLRTLSEARRHRAVDLLSRFGLREEAHALAVESLRTALVALRRRPDSIDGREAVAFAGLTCEDIGADVSTLWNTFENPGSFSGILDDLISEDPENYRQKAALLEALAQPVYDNLDMEKFNRGLELARELTDHDPENAEWQISAASMEARVGMTMFGAGRYSEAGTRFEIAEDRYRRLIQNGIDPYRVKYSYAKLLSWIGENWSILEEKETARDYQERAMRVKKELLAENSEDAAVMTSLAFSVVRMSDVMEGSFEERLAVLESSLEYARRAYEQAPSYAQSNDAWYYSTAALARLCLEEGDLELATKYNDMSLEIQPRFKVKYRNMGLTRRGDIAVAAGDREAAAIAFREAAESWRQYFLDHPPELDVGGLTARMARSVFGFLDCTEPLDEESYRFGKDCLATIRSQMDRLDPKADRLDSKIGGVCRLEDFFAGKALQSGDSEAFREHFGRAVRLRLDWSGKVEDEAAREKLIADLARNVKVRESQAIRHGLATALPDGAASRILEVCDRAEVFEAMPSEPHSASHSLGWLACRSGARVALRNEDTQEASEWLRRGEAVLQDHWERLTERNRWVPEMAKAMGELSEMHALLENESGAAEAMKKAMAWSERLIESGGMRGIQEYLDLATMATSMNRVAHERGLGDAERRPFLKARAEALLGAYEQGDRDHLGPLVSALDAMAHLENRSDNAVAAEPFFRRATELHERYGGADKESFEGVHHRHAAVAWENMGLFAETGEAWSEAEEHYLAGLEAWRGDIYEVRVKVRLANLYGTSGRGDDPQRWRWYSEAVAALEPMEASGELPPMLEWPLEDARTHLASRESPAGVSR